MDSPKCIKCIKKELDAQTYKVAGKQLFYCKSCGSFYSKDSFEPIEFQWRTNKEAWKIWIKEKKLNNSTKSAV